MGVVYAPVATMSPNVKPIDNDRRPPDAWQDLLVTSEAGPRPHRTPLSANTVCNNKVRPGGFRLLLW